MRKCKVTIIAIGLVIGVITSARAQSFNKGSLVANLNTGLEIFNTEYKYQLKNTNLDTIIKDRAGNTNYYFGMEYGVVKWLGLGLKVKVNNYVTGKDKVTGYTPTAHSFEVAFTVRAHLIRTKHFDFPIGLSIGGSSLTYDNNVPNNGITVYGTGSYVDFHIQPMLYFGRFGINMYLGTSGVNYSNMTTSSSNVNKVALLNWKGTGGFVIGVGLQYIFIN